MHIDVATSSTVNRKEKGEPALPKEGEVQAGVSTTITPLSWSLLFTVTRAQGSLMELTISGRMRR